MPSVRATQPSTQSPSVHATIEATFSKAIHGSVALSDKESNRSAAGCSHNASESVSDSTAEHAAAVCAFPCTVRATFLGAQRLPIAHPDDSTERHAEWSAYYDAVAAAICESVMPTV